MGNELYTPLDSSRFTKYKRRMYLLGRLIDNSHGEDFFRGYLEDRKIHRQKQSLLVSSYLQRDTQLLYKTSNSLLVPSTRYAYNPKKNMCFWEHTKSEYICYLKDEIYDLTQSLFKEFKHRSLTSKQVSNLFFKVGHIHYVFAHACPYRRGSAAIADMFCRTLLAHYGIEVGSWKEGLAPDCEALTMPVFFEFAISYEQMFKNKRVFSVLG